MKLKIAVSFLFATAFVAHAYSQTDQVDRTGGARPVRGQIIQESPTAVVVKLSNGNQTIDAKEIRRVNFGDGSNLQKKAISDFYAGNYNNCLDLLDRSEQSNDKTTNPFLKAELAFCRAMSMCREAMSGGNVSLDNAGQKIYEFTTNHSKSFHAIPASQMFAEVCIIKSGAFRDKTKRDEWLKRAKTALKPLLEAKNTWGERYLSANLLMGRIAAIENNNDQAIQYFTAAQDDSITGKAATQIKQIARCRTWQIKGQKGDANAIKELKKIINNESGDDKLFFSNAYNALGHCYLKAGDKKSALLQFLHTQLLYTGNPNTQSEALYYLTQLWNQTNHPDRAGQAQQALRNSYQNTYYGLRSVAAN